MKHYGLPSDRTPIRVCVLYYFQYLMIHSLETEANMIFHGKDRRGGPHDVLHYIIIRIVHIFVY